MFLLLILLSTVAADVPAVSVVIGGDADTLETAVREAVAKRTPTVIVEVFAVVCLDINIIILSCCL